MAICASFLMIENGKNSPHGEMFRFAYNHTIDACGDEVLMPQGAVCYWDFARLLSDQDWPGSPIAPRAPIAATNVAEAYVPVVVTAGTGGFPDTAHQQDIGVCEYAATGVCRLVARVGVAQPLIGMPAGIVVIESPNLARMCFYITGVGGIGTPQQCYIIKTRGIVQALLDDGLGDIVVGDYLEGNVGSWFLFYDAGNTNEGTFIALEAEPNGPNLRWVQCVNLCY